MDSQFSFPADPSASPPYSVYEYGSSSDSGPSIPTGESTSLAGNTPPSSLRSDGTTRYKKQDVNFLKDIIAFHNKMGKYPFEDSHNRRRFYDKWIVLCGFCKDEEELNFKMVELHERFLMNLQKISSSGGELEDMNDWMDPVEINIDRLSCKIWGNDHNHHHHHRSS